MENQRLWEDHLLERKTDRELADIRRTAVAFAYSVMPGHTATILIGEGNGGNVSGVDNPDEQQRKLRRELDKNLSADYLAATSLRKKRKVLHPNRN